MRIVVAVVVAIVVLAVVVLVIRSRRTPVDGSRTQDVEGPGRQALPEVDTPDRAPAVRSTGATIAEPRSEAPDPQPADGSQPVPPAAATRPVLEVASIRIDVHASGRDDAIEQVGRLLVERGAATRAYVDSMHQREETVSTYMGNLLAIPHGMSEAKVHIRDNAMSFIRLAEDVDWDGRPVRFVVGIAARNREHLQILGRLARIFSTDATVRDLQEAQTPQEVATVLSRVNR